MDKIDKSFSPSIWMFYRASRDIYHSNTGAKLFYAFFLGLPLLLLSLWLYNGTPLSSMTKYGFPKWGVLVLCVGYTLIFMPALHYLNVRKRVKTSPSSNQTQNYSLTRNGVRNYGDGFDFFMDWSKIVRIRKSKSFLLLFVSKESALFIPLPLLSTEDLDQIEQWSKDKILV
jgi:YcxB-like protein